MVQGDSGLAFLTAMLRARFALRHRQSDQAAGEQHGDATTNNEADQTRAVRRSRLMCRTIWRSSMLTGWAWIGSL